MPDAPAGPRADQFETRSSFVCDEEVQIRLENVLIVGDGDGITLSGKCRLTLVDSKVDTTGWGIRMSADASMTIRHSEVRGERGAYSIVDNARVHATKSIFRGPSSSKGAASFHDDGGNRRGDPNAAALGPQGKLEPTKAANCTGREGELVIEDKLIEVDKHAVLVQGGCQVTIRNCHIKAKDRAVVLQGAPSVTIERSKIESEGRALVIVGDAEVVIRNSHLKGRVQKVGEAQVIDEGENRYE